MLTENDVVELLADYFQKKKHEIISKCTTTQTGIDLVVRDKKGTYTYIEAKGETSSKEGTNRFGSAFNTGQVNNHIAKALLASLKAMNKHQEGKFAMAFPATASHQKVLEQIIKSVKKLDIDVYLVSRKEIKKL